MTAQAAIDPGTPLAGKYLTFSLGDEGYGLEILKVQEIIGVQKITALPRAPDYLKGVINLRGKVIPVLDLRLKLGMAPAAFTRRTCIVVVQVAHEDGDVIMGVVVDEVSEVLDIDAGQIEPTPALGSSMEDRFILGVAKTEAAVKVLLDIDRLLATEDLRTVLGRA